MDALRSDRDPLLVITGGLGMAATVLRPHLRPYHRLRLVDRAASPGAGDANPWHGWEQRRASVTCWLSPGDAGRLVLAALRATEPHGVHFEVSANIRNHRDTTSAQTDLGYRPEGFSEIFAGSDTSG
ncbi:MAG TPA: hypothetical protein VGJ44_23595 [Kribbellaceae bacterium]|jgi:hypothetical protein